MFKKILIIIIFFSFNNCGFSPVYTNYHNINFKIKNITFDGDRTVNNFLKTNFRKYKSKENDGEFDLDVNTNYSKNVLTKNSSGKITLSKLVLNISIDVKSNDFSKKYDFQEEFLLEDDSDKFDEKNYENIIKQNLTNSIFDNFILKFVNR